MNIIGKSKIWFAFSGLLCATSIIFLIIWGLKPGIDFTGGSLLRLEFVGVRLSNEQISEVLNDVSQYGQPTIQPVGENEVIIRSKELDEEKHQEVLQKLETKAREVGGEAAATENIKETKFDSIGPSIGKELREKSQLAILFVLVAIIAYIAWAFREVSTSISKYESAVYGIFAIVALVHDILITLGVFSFLGHFYNVEVDTFFIAALLTILGYSVNDTIIVFDRIRENIIHRTSEGFPALVNKSIDETIVRSFNTSMATLMVLFCILLFGGKTTYYFILALLIGIFAGTYSSIFLASPLLVWWKGRRRTVIT